MKSRRKLKSGLLVLVDLFSLLTMAMFSVFIISSDVRTSDSAPVEGLKVVQVTIQPESVVAGLNEPWRPINEIIKIRARLVDATGNTVKETASGVSVESLQLPDGLNYSIVGDARGHQLILDIAEINTPRAFLTTFQVDLNELTPNPANSTRVVGVRLGDWHVPPFEL